GEEAGARPAAETSQTEGYNPKTCARALAVRSVGAEQVAGKGALLHRRYYNEVGLGASLFAALSHAVCRLRIHHICHKFRV
ncbi:Protein of unknown function, partial [Gryllus bimaculatus]